MNWKVAKNMQNRQILVSGGPGFIGSELVRQLAAQGARVVVVDNLADGRRENLEGLPPDRVQLVVADIGDSERMAEGMQGMDIVSA